MYSIKKITFNLLQKHQLLIYVQGNFSAKSRSHYDTLKLSPNATHSEIKSAYYKLSLQYHPDKNKSDQAKKIFQDLSNAYEVLGNHKSRKQYDRFISIKLDDIPKSKSHSVEEDITYSRHTKIYDFEEWTREHYTKIFSQNIQRKKGYEKYKQMKEKDQSGQKKFDIVGPIIGFVLFMAYLAYEINVQIMNNDRTFDKGNK